MITFVTTAAALQKIFNHQGGDGIIGRPSTLEGVHTGYEAVRLSTGESRQLAMDLRWPFPPGIATVNFGDYAFALPAMDWVRVEFLNALDLGVEPLFLDPVGGWELEGGGFSELMARLIESGKRAYLGCRAIFLDGLVKRFKILRYSVHNGEGG